ncbi:MAG: protein translocase subunit SecF [Treponema sp.]|nr:protein translocase subunit SecF [Treponema sp.]
MKRIIRFSRLYIPAAIISGTIIIASVAGFFINHGFYLGVDFQAGAIQEVQFAPTAFSITWTGRGNASIAFDRSNMYIVNSGVGVESRTLTFPFSEYPTVGALSQALVSRLEGLNTEMEVPSGITTQWLVRSAQGNPQLGNEPYAIHYLDPQSEVISIATVREAVAGLGENVAVQSLGQPRDRHFMLRLEDKEMEAEAGGAPAERITNALEGYFGSGEVIVLRSDYVGSRFSKNLTEQAGMLAVLTLLLILAYSAIRFRPQYAFGAVIGIANDAIVILGFVIWTRMEFNTSTIAAILTILGYSINTTIVVFDRIRENLRVHPDEEFVIILDRSLSEMLSRTIITTLTTMLAVLSLFIFTTGAMKDFALALLIGMLSGVYTTTFITTGFVNLWDKIKSKRAKQKTAIPAAGAVKGAAKA